MQIFETNELFKQQLSANTHRLTPEETEQVKAVTLEMTKDIVALCDRLAIPYMLGGGSALGAVRHHGFVPWDEDMDINIARPYIKKLLTAVEREYGDKYNIEAPLFTPDYLSTFIQIHKRGTVFQEYLVQKEETAGIKIDIFVIENTYDNRFLRTMHGILVDAGSLLLSCYRMYAWREDFLELAAGNKKALLAIRLKGLLGALVAPFSDTLFRRVIRRMMSCKNNHSKYVTIPTGRKHFFGELYLRETYMATTSMQFEDTSFHVTDDYDSYLTNLYGDYKTLPPESRREHHIIRKLKL